MGFNYLEFVAKVCVIACIILVLYICCYVVWRISRLPNPVQYSPKEINRKPVELPLKVKLSDGSKQTENVVNIHLTCYSHSVVKLLWGIEMNYLAKLMNSPWRSLQSILNEMEENPGRSGENTNSYLAATELVFKRESKDSDSLDDKSSTFDGIVTIKPPKSLKWEDLSNKYLYPLVVVIMPPTCPSFNSTSDTNISDPSIIGDQIDGLFVILHVKNVTAKAATTVLAEYIKMNSGHTFMLKPLFVVEDGLPNDEDDIVSPDEVEEAFSGVRCSVCQSLPVSRAILPCRHVCLCAFCFDKVDRCPICRGPLMHYFCTRSENYMANAPAAESLTRHMTWGQYMYFIGDRLNQILGFY